MKSRTIARNTAYLAVSDVIKKVIRLGYLLLIARFLGDKVFGDYSFIFAFVLFFFQASLFGLVFVFVREVARDREKTERFIGNALSLRIVLAFIATLAVIVAINLLDYEPTVKLAVYIIAAAIIPKGIVSILQGCCQAFEKLAYFAVLDIIMAALEVITGVVLLFLGYNLITICLLHLSVSLLYLGIFGVVVIRSVVPVRPKFELTFWPTLLRQSWPIAIYAFLALVFYKIDIVMLSMIKGNQVVGWYNAAYLFLDGIQFIPIAFTIAVFPLMSQLFQRSKERLHQLHESSFKLFALIALPIMIITTAMANKLILFVYGGNFHESILVLQILIWTTLPYFLDYVNSRTFFASDRQHFIPIIIGTNVLTNIGLNLVLIPRFSHIGAAVATFLSFVVSFILYLFYTRKSLYRLSWIKPFKKPVLASVVMGIVVVLLQETNPAVLIASSLAAYLAVLLLLRVFSEEEVRLLKQVVGLSGEQTIPV